MPTWLVHGFRWPRQRILIQTVLYNLEDVASEWIMGPASHACLLENMKTLYPDLLVHLPNLRFIEQYDPADEVTKSQPYAYVCDQVHEVQLGVDVDEVRGKGVKNEAWSAMADLRDIIAAGQKVGWFVVVNGDVERWAPPLEEEEEEGEYGEEGSEEGTVSARSSVGRVEAKDIEKDDGDSDQTKRPAKGFKKWLVGKARRAKR
jgi:hypothetical protein